MSINCNALQQILLNIFRLPGSLLAAALTSFMKKLPSFIVYLQLQSCHSSKCVGKWVVGLTKRVDEIWHCLEIFWDNSSKIFPDYNFFFLSYNCIFSPIIWSINFVTGGLVPLMNKIHHSYLVWGIFLMWWLHGLHKGIASFSPPCSSLLDDQSSLFFYMI